jgi:hypothetical protein
MRSRLLAAAALVAFAVGGCHIEILGDLEVDWTYEGGYDTSVCADKGVASWRVIADGPERVSTPEYSCDDPDWHTGTDLYGIVEGDYTVTVEALDASGAKVGSHSRAGVSVVGLRTITIDLTAADFAGEQVNVYWNINGTTDGTAKGTSWDTCTEVGATHAIVTVNGTENKFDCRGSGYATSGKVTMSAAVAVSGKPTVQIHLVDSSGKALTSKTPTGGADGKGPTLVSGSSSTWEYVGEFFYDAFYATKNGRYHFTVSYEGKSCSQTSPPVEHLINMLKLDGTAVTVDACGPDNTCAKTNGTDHLKCYASDQTLKLGSLEWGEYEMMLSGAVGTVPSTTICWEKTFKDSDVLVGAGETNPIVDLDVPRTDTTSAACQ